MAGISPANLGAIVDARTGSVSEDIATSHDPIMHELAPPETHGHNTIYLDSSISFENYHWWANRSREVEKNIPVNNQGYKQLFNVAIGKKIRDEKSPNAVPTEDSPNDEKNIELNKLPEGKDSGSDTNGKGINAGTGKYGVTEAEWENAQRATRTATWGTVFYLITTDILGPYNVPWAMSQMGYGPGIALYTVFGGFAYYSAMQLWKMFCGLDSTRYPMRNYGDLAFRIYGNWARIFANVLQSFQFFLNVALLIESNGQGLAQMARGANDTGWLCFVVAEVIFMVSGFVLGQIRTLQRLGFLANLAVWLNIVCIFMTMGVVPQYGPNYSAVLNTYNIPKGPVQTSANWPNTGDGNSLTNGINGLMNGVFAYGGATLFNELMAEMRRPFDFWKSLLIADIFIYAVYMTLGLVVYSYQGQFTYNPAYQGIPNTAFRFQTLGNAINFISGLIAALLYGNIGVKVFYSAVFRDVFRLPPLDHKIGKIIWIVFVPIYWGLAFIIAAAIPQISNLTSFVGAACILQFSFTFPPILSIGYNCQKDAMLPEEEFNPATGEYNRVDQGWTRWMRGYKKKWAINTFDFIYFLGAVATCGLGVYASTTAMHTTYTTTTITPFTCLNPAG